MSPHERVYICYVDMCVDWNVSIIPFIDFQMLHECELEYKPREKLLITYPKMSEIFKKFLMI